MIENFLVYSFGKLRSERKKFHSLELDLHSFWRISLFFLFSPGSTGVHCERCELMFRMSLSLFVVYTVTRHAQTRTWGVQSQLQLHVLFSADLWMGKKTRNLKGQTGVVQNLLYTIDFSIHSFFERKLQYIYDHVFMPTIWDFWKIYIYINKKSEIPKGRQD